MHAKCFSETDVTRAGRMIFLALAAATTLAMGACAPASELEPAPAATPVAAGPGEGAVAMAAGVRMVAQVDAWEARPANLEEEVTPLLVTITNQSAAPLSLRYRHFQLVGPAGQRFAAIPPFRIQGEVVNVVTEMVYPPTGFAVAPYLSPFYPAFEPFAGPFEFDPVYYDNFVTVFQEVDLPTLDMLQRALPEGVLLPQGEVTGFLYFQEVPDDLERVQLVAELVNANTGAQFGTLTIPFVVSAMP